MAAETYVIGGLGTLVTVLGGIVMSSLNKRLSDLETANKDRALDDRALRDAVVKLTVTVELLAKQVERMTGAAE